MAISGGNGRATKSSNCAFAAGGMLGCGGILAVLFIVFVIAVIAEYEEEGNYSVSSSHSPTFASETDMRPLSPEEIAVRTRRSTVLIEYECVEEDLLQNDVLYGSGSGVVALKDSDGDYWILTNSHVIGYYDMLAADDGGAPEILEYNIFVTMHDGVSARVIAVRDHIQDDCCYILIDGTAGDYPVLETNEELPVQGEDVYAMGHPLGQDYTFTRGQVTRVASGSESDDSMGRVQTDAAIGPGNSGGPLVNKRAQLVGINTAILRSGGAEGIGFAISAKDALVALKNKEFYVLPLSPAELTQHLGKVATGS